MNNYFYAFLALCTLCKCGHTKPKVDSNTGTISVIESVKLDQILTDDPVFLATIKIKNQLSQPILLDGKKESFVSYVFEHNLRRAMISFSDSNYVNQDFTEGFYVPFFEENQADSFKSYQNKIELFKSKEKGNLSTFFGKKYQEIDPGTSYTAYRILKLYQTEYEFLLKNKSTTCIELTSFIANGQKMDTVYSKTCDFELCLAKKAEK